MQIFIGDDWPEDHHDVHLMDSEGRKLVSRRIPEGLEGIRLFHELAATHIDDSAEVIPAGLGVRLAVDPWIARALPAIRRMA